jgi:hypothetical protein
MKSMLRQTTIALAIASTLAAAPAFAAVAINDGLDGSWSNSAESGRGIALDVLPNADGSGIVTGGVFSYGADGNPDWFTFVGNFAAGASSVAGVTVNRLSGGSFGSPATAPTVTAVGTATITLNNSKSLSVAFDMNPASGLPDVTLNLTPTQTNLGFPQSVLASDIPTLATCPAGTTAQGDDCRLPASITNALFLPAGKKYIVRGQVAVENGATLTIAPGVTVQGSTDTSTPNFIAVKVGGRIYAEGTAARPITFTGPEASPGSWAGLVIAGRSTCNDAAQGQPCQFEAVPEITYGGDQLNESSGALRYVRILWAGQNIDVDEELNSLTLLGVGAGTVLEHVQVDGGLDDGFEMFGGSVNGRYLVCSNMGDDCFDFDQGYSGKIQFALGWQGTNTDIQGDSNGVESDNDGTNNDKLPRTRPTISNMTLVGSAGGNEGVRLRRGSGGVYRNIAVTGYQAECLNLNDAGTFALGTAAAQGADLNFSQSFIGQCTGGAFEDAAAEPYLVSAWYAAGAGNATGVPEITGFLPNTNSPLLSGGLAPSDAFFRPVTYKGAFAGSYDNWTRGWTVRLPN